MNNGHEAAPLVNGGVMFVSTSFNQVLALDAKSGNALGAIAAPCRPTRGKAHSRGVALFGDKVFVRWAKPRWSHGRENGKGSVADGDW